MPDPAALLAVPDQIRALRVLAEGHKPATADGRRRRIEVIGFLLYAEVAAALLAEEVPVEASDPRPPQQIHAPLADQFEPRVPRRSGHDARLPIGRPHP